MGNDKVFFSKNVNFAQVVSGRGKPVGSTHNFTRGVKIQSGYTERPPKTRLLPTYGHLFETIGCAARQWDPELRLESLRVCSRLPWLRPELGTLNMNLS